MAIKEGYVFLTMCDERYLPRALVLYDSLKKHAEGAKLYIVCLSEQCEKELAERKLSGIVAISKSEVEKAYPKLEEAKGNRSAFEYFYTLTPAVCKYALDHCGAKFLTYLDSDMCFFSSPEPVLDSLEGASVGITPHRFSPSLKRLEPKVGHFNVGWVSFRGDEDGKACCQWWLDSCLEWCYDRYEEERFADQKYLNQFPKRFRNVVSIDHVGVNTAPWNVGQFDVTLENGVVLVDGKPLVIFHFADFMHFKGRLYLAGTCVSGITLKGPLRTAVYQVYLDAMTSIGGPLPKSLRFPRGLGIFSLVGLRLIRRMLLACLRREVLVASVTH